MSNDLKIVFIDTEFTGEHAYTTLVSLGIITLDNQELYITLNDYSEEQVTPWLKENVISHIDPSNSISSSEAYVKVENFLSNYANHKKLYIVSRGLLQDYLLLIQLYHYSKPQEKFFHALNFLPEYLNHHAGIDLNTLLRTAGIDPSIDLFDFNSKSSSELIRHRSIDDAKLVRDTFLKLKKHPSILKLLSTLG